MRDPPMPQPNPGLKQQQPQQQIAPTLPCRGTEGGTATEMSSSLSPLDSSSPAAAEVPLAPGFRFHPTDEELVSYYLRRRVLGRRLRVDAIAEVDLYRLEPWDLPSLSRIRSRDSQWYFFARLDRKVTGAGAGGRGGPGNRTNRATPRGYWKTTGKDREIHHRGKPAGMKKTLVFHAGRAPKGERTNWVMHEYRLLDTDGPQDLQVVCRIFQKVGSGPQNGAQYGAPYMEEEWEEDDEAIENGPASGTAAQIVPVTDALDEESNGEDENEHRGTNEPAQVQEEVLNLPEMAPLKAEDSKETSDGSYAQGAISLEEILQESLSNAGAVNAVTGEGQNAMPADDSFSEADWTGCPTKDADYAVQDGTMNWSDPAGGDHTRWPLREYRNQNHVNGTLTAEELFGTSNDVNENSDYQTLDPQADGSMVFYDAPSDNNWVDGNADFVYLNDLLNDPFENQFLFGGDDMMTYFDAPETDLKYDISGPVESSNYQLTDMSNPYQKVDNKDELTSYGFSNVSDANEQFRASSSGSHKAMDDTEDKPFSKRLTNMLGSIPAPPALASEFPPVIGKSVGPLSDVNPSSIRVTAGIIRLGGLTFTGGAERWPLQKNGDFSLLLSFTVESDMTSKSIDYEPATRMGTTPMVMRSGFYLFFVSAMILMLSYKVGSCIYSN